MSLYGIRLWKFRGFRDAELKLKKLTVLVGANSSGKSSFGHALASMAHAHRVYRSTPQGTLTPTQSDAVNWPVDLGQLKDLRTNGTVGPVTIGLYTDAGEIKLGFGLDQTPSLLPSYFSLPEGLDTAAQMLSKKRASKVIPEGNQTQIKGAVTYFSSTSGTAMPGQKARLELQRVDLSRWIEGENKQASVVVLQGLLPIGFAHEGGTSRSVNFKALKELEFLFENLTYLRGSRRRAFRSYPKEVGQQQRIGYGGEWTATVLQEKHDVSYAQLPALPPRPPKKPKPEYDFSIKKQPLNRAVRNWLNHLGIATSAESLRAEKDPDRLSIMVTLPSQQRRNLTEVGFGVSQVLPIIVAGLLQPKDSLFIVDLPEAHLHPAPQAELADFFCSLALSGRYSLVETHSEMFFDRLRLRAEMIPQLRENIAVYFLDAATQDLCCMPREVGLELDNEVEWPTGFFQEGWEMEVRLGSLRRMRHTDKK
jgi:predicted ATPase